MTLDSFNAFVSKNKELISSLLVSTVFGALLIGILATIFGGYILNRIEEKRLKSSN